MPRAHGGVRVEQATQRDQRESQGDAQREGETEEEDGDVRGERLVAKAEHAPSRSRESARGSNAAHALRQGPSSTLCTRPRDTVTLTRVLPVDLRITRSCQMICCRTRMMISAGLAAERMRAILLSRSHRRSTCIGSVSSTSSSVNVDAEDAAVRDGDRCRALCGGV